MAISSFAGGVSDTLGTSGLNGFKADASYLPGGGTSATGVNGANAFENGAGSYGTHIGTAVGLNNPGGQSAAASQQQSIQNQIGAEQGVINTENQQGNQYYGGVQNATNDYTQSLNNNTGNYINTQTGIYNNLNPQYQQLTNNAMSNANGAETLQQAETPNNAIEQGVQGMYNTQAQGITNQGLADYGVLAALGGQATANTIGGAGQPVTGGQMQALQGANMGQASQAFGQAQNQANTLKAQGLQAGINQNNIDYGEGQQAQQTAQGALAQQGNFENQNASNTLGAYMGAAQGNYNANANLAGVQYGIQQGQDQSQMGMINQTYGAQQQADISAAQAANAQQAGKLGAIGSFAGAIGGGLASMYSPSSYTGGGGGGSGGGGGGGIMGGISQGAALGQQQGGLVGQASGNQAYTTPGPGGYNQSPTNYSTSTPSGYSGGGASGGYNIAQAPTQPGPANTGYSDYNPGGSFSPGSPYNSNPSNVAPGMNNEDIAPGNQNPASSNPYQFYS